MFGEVGWPIPRRRYGHPLHTAATNLQKVPWLVDESGERRKVHSGTLINSQNINDENIQERLKHLGYK